MADDELAHEAEELRTEADKLATLAQAKDTDALVDHWLKEYFPDSVISRNSAGWRHIETAAAELKRRLKGA